MLKSTLALLSFSAILQLIGASSVTITSPKANDVLKPGSEVKIEWSVNESSTQTIRIQYASGPSKELSIDGVIAENVSASLGHYVWKVPSNLKPKQ
ncbi:hypothetical protein BD560DRAFT_322133 [Blakeslea trispora]|nr:hypothetical protein BD560DRAFT_322133 [Blakeslea trispora]